MLSGPWPMVLRMKTNATAIVHIESIPGHLIADVAKLAGSIEASLSLTPGSGPDAGDYLGTLDIGGPVDARAVIARLALVASVTEGVNPAILLDEIGRQLQ